MGKASEPCREHIGIGPGREPANRTGERSVAWLLAQQSQRHCEAARGRGLAAERSACNNTLIPGLYPAVNAVLSYFDVVNWIRWLLPAPEEGAVESDLPMTDEDAGRLARVAGGDERALQQLFDKWKLPLLSFFYRSLGSHADAEDLTLEVFVRLHRSAGGYRPTAKFSTYLFHIAQNLLRNEYRRRQRKPAQPAPPELFDTVASETTGPNQRVAELEEMLQQGLARLPEKQRTALLLVYQKSMDYRSAAALLKTTENALRVLVHRARQLLKTEMEALP